MRSVWLVWGRNTSTAGANFSEFPIRHPGASASPVVTIFGNHKDRAFRGAVFFCLIRLDARLYQARSVLRSGNGGRGGVLKRNPYKSADGLPTRTNPVTTTDAIRQPNRIFIPLYPDILLLSLRNLGYTRLVRCLLRSMTTGRHGVVIARQ